MPRDSRCLCVRVCVCISLSFFADLRAAAVPFFLKGCARLAPWPSACIVQESARAPPRPADHRARWRASLRGAMDTDECDRKNNDAFREHARACRPNPPRRDERKRSPARERKKKRKMADNNRDQTIATFFSPRTSFFLLFCARRRIFFFFVALCLYAPAVCTDRTSARSEVGGGCFSTRRWGRRPCRPPHRRPGHRPCPRWRRQSRPNRHRRRHQRRRCRRRRS